MRSLELLAFGIEDPLAGRLVAWSQDHGIWYRGVEHESAICNLLSKGSRGVLLSRIGRNLAEELQLIVEVSRSYRDVTIVVLGDLDHPLLEGLVYDLGASAVLFPPRGPEDIFELLTRLFLRESER